MKSETVGTARVRKAVMGRRQFSARGEWAAALGNSGLALPSPPGPVFCGLYSPDWPKGAGEGRDGGQFGDDVPPSPPLALVEKRGEVFAFFPLMLPLLQVLFSPFSLSPLVRGVAS